MQGKLQAVLDTMQWADKVDIHTCQTLLSGLPEASHWPKMVSEAIL